MLGIKMGKRGRKKLVDKILEVIKGEDEKGEYLIVYDLPTTHMPKELYIALQHLMDKGFFLMRVQKSVYLTNSSMVALAVREIVKHYGGEAKIYKIEKEL